MAQNRLSPFCEPLARVPAQGYEAEAACPLSRIPDIPDWLLATQHTLFIGAQPASASAHPFSCFSFLPA